MNYKTFLETQKAGTLCGEYKVSVKVIVECLESI